MEKNVLIIICIITGLVFIAIIWGVYKGGSSGSSKTTTAEKKTINLPNTEVEKVVVPPTVYIDESIPETKVLANQLYTNKFSGKAFRFKFDDLLKRVAININDKNVKKRTSGSFDVAISFYNAAKERVGGIEKVDRDIRMNGLIVDVYRGEELVQYYSYTLNTGLSYFNKSLVQEYSPATPIDSVVITSEDKFEVFISNMETFYL